MPSPLPLFSGLLATKGGVLFTGDQRGRLLAYDAKTGKEVWKFQTGSASTLRRSPTSWTASSMSPSCPGLGGDPSFYYSAPKGGMLWVFAIDGKVQEARDIIRPSSRRCCRRCSSSKLAIVHAPAQGLFLYRPASVLRAGAVVV